MVAKAIAEPFAGTIKSHWTQIKTITAKVFPNYTKICHQPLAAIKSSTFHQIGFLSIRCGLSKHRPVKLQVLTLRYPIQGTLKRVLISLLTRASIIDCQICQELLQTDPPSRLCRSSIPLILMYTYAWADRLYYTCPGYRHNWILTPSKAFGI